MADDHSPAQPLHPWGIGVQPPPAQQSTGPIRTYKVPEPIRVEGVFG